VPASIKGRPKADSPLPPPSVKAQLNAGPANSAHTGAVAGCQNPHPIGPARAATLSINPSRTPLASTCRSQGICGVQAITTQSNRSCRHPDPIPGKSTIALDTRHRAPAPSQERKPMEWQFESPPSTVKRGPHRYPQANGRPFTSPSIEDAAGIALPMLACGAAVASRGGVQIRSGSRFPPRRRASRFGDQRRTTLVTPRFGLPGTTPTPSPGTELANLERTLKEVHLVDHQAAQPRHWRNAQIVAAA